MTAPMGAKPVPRSESKSLASFDDPAARERPRSLARRATEAMARHADLMLLEIAGQVRSTAADLVRAAQAGEPDDDGMAEASTEEMLATGDSRATPDDAPA
jgi:hypothetical protein